MLFELTLSNMETCIVVLTFESVDEILWCDNSNEISLAVLSHSTISFAGLDKIKFGLFFLIFTLATTRSDRVKTEMLASNPGFLVDKLFIFWRNVTCYIWPQGRFPFSQNFRFNRLKCKRGSTGNFPERTDVLGGTSPLFPFQPVGLGITLLFAQNFHFCCSRYKLVTFVP